MKEWGRRRAVEDVEGGRRKLKGKAEERGSERAKPSIKQRWTELKT